jgi:hypothetical protein
MGVVGDRSPQALASGIGDIATSAARDSIVEM